jgi:hypothetical protein
VEYRLYLVGPNRKLYAPEVIAAADDDAAKALAADMAKRLPRGWAVELWDGGRFILMLSGE